jgi:hypothetical protein
VRERRAEVSGGHICSVDGEDNITSPERRATSRMRGQSTDGCGCSRKGQSPLPQGIRLMQCTGRWDHLPTPWQGGMQVVDCPGRTPAGNRRTRLVDHQPYRASALLHRPRVQVTADGQGMVGHAGVRLLADLAERSGLEGALSTALRPLRQRRRRHEPGSVLVDLAVTLADGGDCLSDLQVLHNQPGVFGEVASQTTA